MFLVDANVLLYAVNGSAAQHGEANAWLAAALSGSEDVGFTDLVEIAFLRLSTRQGIFPRPLTVAQACTALGAWHSAGAAVRVAGNPVRTCELLGGTGTAGNLVNDAHLAAIAIERSATIVTFDRDFGRFPGVTVHLLGGTLQA